MIGFQPHISHVPNGTVSNCNLYTRSHGQHYHCPNRTISSLHESPASHTQESQNQIVKCSTIYQVACLLHLAHSVKLILYSNLDYLSLLSYLFPLTKLLPNISNASFIDVSWPRQHGQTTIASYKPRAQTLQSETFEPAQSPTERALQRSSYVMNSERISRCHATRCTRC